MALFLLEAFPCSQAEFCCSVCTVHSVGTINGQVMIFWEIRISAMERTSWKEHFQVGSIFYTSNISFTMWNFVIIPVCTPYIAFHVLKLEQLKKYIFFFTVVKVTDIKHTILTIFNCIVQGHKYIHIVVKLSPSSISRIFHLPKLKFYPHWTVTPQSPSPSPSGPRHVLSDSESDCAKCFV